MSELRKILAAPKPPAGASVRNALWSTYLRACNRREDAEKTLAADPVAKALLTAPVMRADATPGGSTTVGWGDELVGSSVRGYMSSLAPLSAAAKLFTSGEQFRLDGTESISFPSNVNVATPSWVAEDGAIPVISGAFSASTLGPTRKLSFIIPATRELWKRANGRAAFDAITRDTIAAQLDAAVFSDTAGSASAHRGLLDGVTPVLQLSGAGPLEHLTQVLSALIDAGGSGDALIVTTPAIATQIKIALPMFNFPVLPSRGVASGVIIAVDPSTFASGMGELEILPSSEATIHMSDVPLEIVSGTGPTTADPVRSSWQTASIFLRVILDCAWVSRGDRVVVMEDVTWF